MKKVTLATLVFMLVLSACEDKKKALAESAVNAKIDSLVAEKLQDVNAKAMEDLNRRISIEVKIKADSILEARKPKDRQVDNTADALKDTAPL